MAEKLNHHQRTPSPLVLYSSFTFTRRIISGQGARPPPRIIYTYNFCTAINKPPQDYIIITENEAPPPPVPLSLLGRKVFNVSPVGPTSAVIEENDSEGIGNGEESRGRGTTAVYRDERARMRRIN